MSPVHTMRSTVMLQDTDDISVYITCSNVTVNVIVRTGRMN